MIHTGRNTILEVFLKSRDGKRGYLEILQDGRHIRKEAAGNGYFRWIKVKLKKKGSYQIKISEAEVSQAYLYGTKGLFQRGVRFLKADEEKKEITEFSRSGFAKILSIPFRETYHFSPFKNWMNDPNGFCRYRGWFHLYFQANPHAQSWDNMYWGHAVSRDLMRWKQLPYAREPQQGLLRRPDLVGGAFSGCAVAGKNKALFFLTRHTGPRHGTDGAVQKQFQMLSRDMLHFTEEKEISLEKPAGASEDFRDPSVSKIGGSWYLTLGSRIRETPSILLYESRNLKQWNYKGVLAAEPKSGARSFECPSFFRLDGRYVAVGSLMEGTDERGRRSMTRYYIGDFNCKTGRFEPVHSGWLDFGGNFYALQSFEHKGRRIAIGWAADLYQEHRFARNASCGSASLPRELHVIHDRLSMKPAREAGRWKGRKLYSGRGENITLERIRENRFYCRLRLKNCTEFSILLGISHNRKFSLTRKNGVTAFKTGAPQCAGIRFEADVDQVEEIELFVDGRLTEVFLNGGEAVGTKLFYNERSDGILRIEFRNPEEIHSAQVYEMRRSIEFSP